MLFQNKLLHAVPYQLAAALLSLPVVAEASTLYIDANIAASGQNGVLAYTVAADGSLSPLRGSPFPTGGSGFVDSSYKLGTFDNDQEVTFDPSRKLLYAVNAGSNTVAAFTVSGDGALSALPHSPFRSHGSTPVSLGLRGDLLTIIDNALDPAQASFGVVPSVTVERVAGNGQLRPVPSATYALPAADEPSQALVANTAPFVFNTSQPNDPSVQAFYQYPDGRLYQTDKVVPPKANGVQPFPLGLWASPKGPFLYVGLDFLTQTSSGLNVPSKLGVYRWSSTGKLTLVEEAASAGGALCWIRGSKDGKYLYTSNTFDNSVSVFDTAKPDAPVEIEHLVIGGTGGLEQLSLTPDGRFLYVLEEINSAAAVGHSNVVYALAVDQGTGLVTLERDLTVKLPVSASTRPFGLAIR